MNDTSNTPFDELSDDADEQLTLYLLGEAPAEIRTAVEKRLLADPSFRREHDARRSAIAMIRDFDPSAPVLPDADRDALRQELATSANTTRRASSALTWGSVAAIAFLAGTLWLLLGEHGLRRGSVSHDESVASMERTAGDRHAPESELAQREAAVPADTTRMNEARSNEPSQASSLSIGNSAQGLDPATTVSMNNDGQAQIAAIQGGPQPGLDVKIRSVEAKRRDISRVPQLLEKEQREVLSALKPDQVQAHHSFREEIVPTPPNLQLNYGLQTKEATVGLVVNDALGISGGVAGALGGQLDEQASHSSAMSAVGLSQLDVAPLPNNLAALLEGLPAGGFDNRLTSADDIVLFGSGQQGLAGFFASPPQIHGVVTGFAPQGKVRLGLDGDIAVQPGHPFEVRRAGALVGVVQVDEVVDGVATGTVVRTEPGESFQIGDGVRTSEDAALEAQRKLFQAQREQRLEAYFKVLCRRPNETPNMMFFRYWGDNPFYATTEETKSTFGMDVDTASYTLTRRYLRDGHLPPRDAIRTEEFVNYFPSNLAAPTDATFAIYAELAQSPFRRKVDGEAGSIVHVLKIGVKAREIAEELRKPLSLVFVVDVSGSMEQNNRLGLVQQVITSILPQLRPEDSVGIVTFNTQAQIVLPLTPATNVDAVAEAVRAMKPGGSTNVEHGLQLGYSLLGRVAGVAGQLRNQRIVLFSDGVANVGNTSAQSILGTVAEQRSAGTFLSTFGVGMGNHNDTLLEQLADRGNGQCAYIDSFAEGLQLFRRGLAEAFETVAKDAKIQVEFDPTVVTRFRQIGYENRQIAHENFRNDKVDAGEVNAGDEVVALYEVELAPNAEGSLGKIHVRYQDVDSGEVVEQGVAAPVANSTAFDDATPRFRLAVCAAAFAESLRSSYWSRETTLAHIRELALGLRVLDTSEERRVTEFCDLLETAGKLRATLDADTALAELIARYKERLIAIEQLRDRIRREDIPELQQKIESLELDQEKLEQEIRETLASTSG
ncbi:MAG: von Willebrand factor type A domain-containing protein [Planctomycetes bacterium]|nr:von Willebrand factor type A domain-containing protein [Planctomycetota bacterium]